jgi:hypothetical protein
LVVCFGLALDSSVSLQTMAEAWFLLEALGFLVHSW